MRNPYQYYKSREKSVSCTVITSRALQQVGRKSEAETSCYIQILRSWTGLVYFWKSKLNSSIQSRIPSGLDRTAAVHVLLVLCGSALASYPWHLAPMFVACTTIAYSSTSHRADTASDKSWAWRPGNEARISLHVPLPMNVANARYHSLLGDAISFLVSNSFSSASDKHWGEKPWVRG